MDVTGNPVPRADRNLTVRPGRWPALKMEHTIMNGMHPQFSFDLAKLAREEELARARREMLIHQAHGGQKRNASVVRSIRRAFGGAIISVGQRVHGERLESLDAAPSPAALRMAR